jgi:hypothetical protein
MRKRTALAFAISAVLMLTAGTALADHGHGCYGGHHHHGPYGFGVYVAPPVVAPPVVVYPAPVPPPVYYGYPYVHRYYAYPSSSFHYHGRNFGLSIGF